jgi:hypothetical protein
MRRGRSRTAVEAKLPRRRKDDSLYGEETAQTRQWAAAYIARNHEMLA